MASRIKRLVPVTVNDVLDGHVKLTVDCLDRVYLHGYLGRLQVSGQLVQFLKHRGYPIPSAACLQQIGDSFRRRVASFAEANHIPVVPLTAADRNIEVMQPYLDAAARSGRSQVAAIGVAQETRRVFIARKRHTDPARCPQFSFDKKDRRVTVYYFYLHDASFGPAFIKVCTYCPWPMKIYPLTELRRESCQFSGRVLAGGSTVAARDRIGRAAGSGGAGGASGGVFAGDGRPVRAVSLLDPSGSVVAPAAAFLKDLQACGRPETTQRSYGMALLRWFRFAWAVGVPWDQATRAEARDFTRWLQVAGKPVRPHWRRPGNPPMGPALVPGARPAPNPVTGKTPPGTGYAPATAAHCETVARSFYEFCLQTGTGPMVNPFPLAPDRRGWRPNVHHNPMEPFRDERSGLYRPRLVQRTPRQIPDEKFSELFAALGSHRRHSDRGPGTRSRRRHVGRPAPGNSPPITPLSMTSSPSIRFIDRDS